MLVIPAIDLRQGCCVRLEQGLMEKATVYGDKPGVQARRWQDCGARRLHVVDLDGAFAGKPQNRQAVASILQAVDVPVQLGGGVRDMATLEGYLELGVSWVILGTAALEDPDFVRQACERFPGQVLVGIDAKDGRVAVRGWADVSNTAAVELGQTMAAAGAAALIYTDISRDGMLEGPNLDAIQRFAAGVSVPVIASGGVARLEDIEALKALEPEGVSGVITGKAIYTGALDLAAAVTAAGA